MVKALLSGSSGSRLTPGRGHKVGKTLEPNSGSLCSGV